MKVKKSVKNARKKEKESPRKTGGKINIKKLHEIYVKKILRKFNVKKGNKVQEKCRYILDKNCT